MDDAANQAPNQLPLSQTWTDDTPLDQIPAEHRHRVHLEREKAAADKVAADAAAAKQASVAAKKASGSGSKTKGKVTAPKTTGKKAVGARSRKKATGQPEAAETDDADRVTVVLQTSRFRGRDGRAIARRTPVLVTVDRGLELIMQGYAREGVEGDKPAVAYLD